MECLLQADGFIKVTTKLKCSLGGCNKEVGRDPLPLQTESNLVQ